MTSALPSWLVDERLIVTIPSLQLTQPKADHNVEGDEVVLNEDEKGDFVDKSRLIVVLEVLVQEGYKVFSLHQDNLEVVAELRELFDHRADFGVHGVRDLEGLEKALGLGSLFILTDFADADLVNRANDAGLPIAAAALTPNEVAHAAKLGAAAVQVFPADLLGGGYPEALRKIVGDVSIIARGGLGGWSAGRWFDAGAVACCLDETMLGDAFKANGNLAQLRDRAQSYLTVLVDHPRK